MKFSRFGSGWFGSAPMWGTMHYIFEWRPLLDVIYFTYSLLFQESFPFKSVKTNAAYSVVQSPTCSKLPTLYYWNIFDPFNLIITWVFFCGSKNHRGTLFEYNQNQFTLLQSCYSKVHSRNWNPTFILWQVMRIWWQINTIRPAIDKFIHCKFFLQPWLELWKCTRNVYMSISSLR